MAVSAMKVPTGPIPTPPDPKTDDIADKSDYINKALTSEQKEQLISSAEQFADIMAWGSATGVTSHIAGPDYSGAARNINHYRYGKGVDMLLDGEDVEAMEREIKDFKAKQNENLVAFVNDIGKQFCGGGLEAACFILQTTGPNKHWLGHYGTGRWYYALGGFLYSFGARADRIIVENPVRILYARIRYKVYIFDRYNWDMGKKVSFPKKSVDSIDILTPGSIDPAIGLPTGLGDTYIEEVTKANGEAVYKVDDALMGSLAADGKADFYNVKGQSGERITYVKAE